jgi:hypothetical protein
MTTILLAAALLQAEGKALDAARELAGGGEKPEFAWVDARIREWQPKPSERKLDLVGWAKDIRDAIRLGREHQRPVFLFTLDGRMDVGRC